MREILFRGQRTDSEEWVYGGYYSLNSKHYIVEQIILPPSRNCNGRFDCVGRPVKEETVGQYIGANDKNGTKVFEGDIMNCDDHNTIFDVVCEADDIIPSPYRFRPNYKSGYIPTNFYPEDHKIIGNIYDNPELINNYYKNRGKNESKRTN